MFINARQRFGATIADADEFDTTSCPFCIPTLHWDRLFMQSMRSLLTAPAELMFGYGSGWRMVSAAAVTLHRVAENPVRKRLLNATRSPQIMQCSLSMYRASVYMYRSEHCTYTCICTLERPTDSALEAQLAQLHEGIRGREQGMQLL